MSRSVNVPSGSVATFYFGYDEDSDFFYDLISELCSTIESVENRFYQAASNEWIGQEGRVISKCGIAKVVLSEYCGLCSLAVVPCEDADEEAWAPLQGVWKSFAETWSTDFAEKLGAALPQVVDLYRRVGCFSNGECVYERVAV